MADERYWVYVDHRIDGPYPVKSLKGLTGFNEVTLICPEDGKLRWSEAREIAAVRSGLGFHIVPPQPEYRTLRPVPSPTIMISGDLISPNYQFDQSPTQPAPRRNQTRRSGKVAFSGRVPKAFDWTPPPRRGLRIAMGLALIGCLSAAGWAGVHYRPWIMQTVIPRVVQWSQLLYPQTQLALPTQVAAKSPPHPAMTARSASDYARPQHPSRPAQSRESFHHERPIRRR